MMQSIDLGDQVIAINGKKVSNREESRQLFKDIKKEVLRLNPSSSPSSINSFRESGGKKVDFEVQITRRRLRRLKLSPMPKMLVSEVEEWRGSILSTLNPSGSSKRIRILRSSSRSLSQFIDRIQCQGPRPLPSPLPPFIISLQPAINLRCMVSSVDGGWKSVAKKVFQVSFQYIFIPYSFLLRWEILSFISLEERMVKKWIQWLQLRLHSLNMLKEYVKDNIDKREKNSLQSFIRVWFARAKDPVCVRQVSGYCILLFVDTVSLSTETLVWRCELLLFKRK